MCYTSSLDLPITVLSSFSPTMHSAIIYGFVHALCCHTWVTFGIVSLSFSSSIICCIAYLDLYDISIQPLLSNCISRFVMSVMAGVSRCLSLWAHYSCISRAGTAVHLPCFSNPEITQISFYRESKPTLFEFRDIPLNYSLLKCVCMGSIPIFWSG